MSRLNGRMRVVVAIETSEGAATTFVPIRPPGVGIQWEIIWAIGRQGDGNVVHGWQWYDPENPAGEYLYGVIGAINVALPLGAMGADLPNVSMGTWWATYDRYPCYRWEASAAEKVGKVIAIVVEQVGVEGAH